MLNQQNERRIKRNKLIQKLKEYSIGCSVYYPQPVPRMKYYNDKYNINPNEYKNASIISDYSIALPVGPHLDEDDMDVIYKTFLRLLGEV